MFERAGGPGRIDVHAADRVNLGRSLRALGGGPGKDRQLSHHETSGKPAQRATAIES